MARPKNKRELLGASQQSYEKLMEYTDRCTEEAKETVFPVGTMNRNIRDVLAHLHHWHIMMLEWYKVRMVGTKTGYACKGIHVENSAYSK